MDLLFVQHHFFLVASVVLYALWLFTGMQKCHSMKTTKTDNVNVSVDSVTFIVTVL